MGWSVVQQWRPQPGTPRLARVFCSRRLASVLEQRTLMAAEAGGVSVAGTPHAAAPATATADLDPSRAMHPDHNDAIVDAATVTHELVSNAVLAGATVVTLRLSLRDPDGDAPDAAAAVRVEVFDDAEGMPVLAPHSLTAPHGRGLRIVEALASEWGTAPWDGGRKVVWADIAIPAPAVVPSAPVTTAAAPVTTAAAPVTTAAAPTAAQVVR